MNASLKNIIRRLRRLGFSWRKINAVLFGKPENGCRAYWILYPRS